MRKLNVAIVGATGMVGQTFLKVLEEGHLPLGEVVLLASKKSVGKEVSFRGQTLVVEELTRESLDPERFQFALFSAGGGISSTYAPLAVEKGMAVIDNSSAFRMAEGVPLIVPEVNMPEAKEAKLLANPNCSTIQSVLPLSVIDDLFSVKRVAYTTYQAVSGSGQKGVEDFLATQRGEAPSFYPKAIYNNCLPHIDVFLSDGSTKEEEKMVEETRKILGKKGLQVTATCVRVPVLNGHSVAMNVTCERPIDYGVLAKALERKEGLLFFREPHTYPVATEATGKDLVLVGRLREDLSQDNSLHLWCVADNVRKGAASNAVQILEKIWEERI